MTNSFTDHESTKRVLFHVVNTYQSWREYRLGVPNEFTDDAVRIGEQHLRDVDWFPEDKGWLPNGTDQSPDDGAKVKRANVLHLMNEELRRLRDQSGFLGVGWTRGRRRSWVDGCIAAREVAAKELEEIRDAYVALSIAQDAEALARYDIEDSHI